MREEFFIEHRGKRYCLYSGLVDDAHEKGLRSIDTNLIQVPTNDNGNVAVVKAVVEAEDGRSFSGIGDASPENVGRNIVPHIIRMAETRGKARALRDFCNVGVTALEELSDGEESSAPRHTPRRGQPKPYHIKDDDEPTSPQDNKATRKQLNYLEALVEDVVEDGVAKFEEVTGKAISELTQAEASDWIGKFSGGESAKEAPASPSPTPISQGRQTRSRDANKTPGGALVEDANNLIDLLGRSGKKKAEEGPRVYKLNQSEVEAETAQYQERGSG